MRIIQIGQPEDLKKIMQDIKVDPYGIKIMSLKAITHLVKINSLSNIAANILKQEMLSLGGDVAIARDALTGKAKKTDCLMMGNLSQFNCLQDKLNRQPFGLNRLAVDLRSILENYQKDSFVLALGKYKLNLAKRTYIMGIVNLTPDSFSGDGLLQIGGTLSCGLLSHSFDGKCPVTVSRRLTEFVEKMVADGVDIIDIGGESSRPQARQISVKEEVGRTIPIIKILSRKLKAPISIDTYKPEVAKQALDNGALMVNDITGLRNPKMAKLVAQYKAAVVIMHMQGRPQSMQKNPVYGSLIDEIIAFLKEGIDRALCAGVERNKIIIDPGIGFGKTLEHNLEILKRLREFKVLGQPIMVGTSRKSFIGKILNREPQERIFGASTSLSTNGERSRTIGTISSCILAAQNGANILRVHDVKAVKQALKVLNAINKV